MRRLVVLLTMLLVAGVAAIGQPTQKTLVKTLALPEDLQTLVVDLDVALEVVYWDEPYMRIVTDIQANVAPHVLKALVAAGRYDYELHTDIENVLLLAPNKDKRVVIGGNELRDEWTLTIYLPHRYHLEHAMDQPVF